MSLFRKNNEEKNPVVCSCDCSAEEGKETSCCEVKAEGICCIKVLGSGCKSCHALYENAQMAVKKAGLNVEVEYITDLQKIVEYGVMSMPALVVNETVVSAGKVLKPEDIEKYLR